MKNKILSILIIFFLCGCSKNEITIYTNIEETDESVIGINYPITNTKLDKTIQNDIDSIYQEFKSEQNDERTELNVDYVFNDLTNYISVGLFIYDSNKKNTSIITYAYDKNKQTLINLDDLINDDLSYDKFTFNDNALTVYEDNETKEFAFDELSLKVEILEESEKNEMKKFEKVSKVIDPNSKVIAFTFDDGPSVYTDELIEYLHEQDCSATFFILGNKVEKYSDVLQKSLSYGNELGNHSYNHKWLIKLDKDSINEQIIKTQDIIKEYTGYTPTIMRPTYGSINEDIRKSIDLDIVLWNVDTLDWKYKNVNTIVKRATSNLNDGNIILMHDTHKRTIEAIKKIIPIIKEKGFTCVTISELKEINLIRDKLNE